MNLTLPGYVRYINAVHYMGRRIPVRGAAVTLLLAIMPTGLLSCTQRPIEQVVTTDANRSSALPAGAEPIAVAPDLPQRDENIEAAGDRIAEAITYLNTRRRDRREVALRALNQAEAAMYNALRLRPDDDPARTGLRTVLKDLEAAERTVQRYSEISAARQLAALNRNLDNLDLRPAADQATKEAESPTPPMAN